MNYFYAPHIAEGADFLDEGESAHCIRVLRYKEGDKIGLLDGKGGKYTAFIRQADFKNVLFDIAEQEIVNKSPYRTHIAIAPTKNSDRMEWMVEKLTEIGVNKISLFYSKNSERRKYKTIRLQKKIISALKQSQNPFLPQLHDPVEFETLLTEPSDDQKFIAFVDNENSLLLHQAVKKNKPTTVLIGPEGDFTSGEVRAAENNGYKKISLGKNVLRTETAGIIACHSITLINSL